MRELNLLNGDCARDGWQQAERPGEVLVWRENYLEGALPQDCDPDTFNRVRATELHRHSPEKSAAAILTELRAMHRTLTGLQRGDRLRLWFDRCPFDRTMLARILTLLDGMTDRPEVRLIAADTVWDAAAFRQTWPEKILTAADFAVGTQRWRDYLRGAAPETLLDLLYRATP